MASHSRGTTGPPDDKAEAGSARALDDGDRIDRTIFDQILEMDDGDPTQEFSKGLVYDFLEQAEATFTNMDKSLADRDLEQLSHLGHFLKGSSATLGLTKVKDECEKIQNFGSHRNATGSKAEPDDDVCLDCIRSTLVVVKREYGEVEKTLRAYYHDA
ncbi:MAG: hypothetical protein M1826_007492 [Phylliscum demangeonii]|nr:MAG: hypothetical protein M1826_007492 [Phylliscum demangeonii]